MSNNPSEIFHKNSINMKPFPSRFPSSIDPPTLRP